MRIYLAGVGGMLGEALHTVLGEKHELMCTDIDVNEPWLEKCDFRNFIEYVHQVSTFQPEMLMHIGAHNVISIPVGPDDATGQHTAGRACHKQDRAEVYWSCTSARPELRWREELYDDWDLLRAIGGICWAKYLGENAVENSDTTTFHISCPLNDGGGLTKDKKSINKVMKQLASRATESISSMISEAPATYTVVFARNLAAMIETRYFGLYNMVCGGETGRLEVAQELLRTLSLEDKVRITPVASAYFLKEYFAPRPARERLINYKLRLRNMDMMRDWRIALMNMSRTTFQRVFELCSDYDSGRIDEPSLKVIAKG